MAIRWDKFTIKAQEAIQQANEIAGQNGNPEMLPLHLLAGLLRDQEGIVVPVLAKLGVNAATLESQVAERIERLPKVSGAAAQPHLSAAMSRMLDQAFKEADTFKDLTDVLLKTWMPHIDKYRASRATPATYLPPLHDISGGPSPERSQEKTGRATRKKSR